MFNRAGLRLAILIVASSGLYLIGNGSVALWDRDEPRFAQTSRQMWQSGDWVVPHYLDLIRTAKPPLIYWCQATAMSVLGDNAFAARLPSAVAIIVLLILLPIVLVRHIGPQRTLWMVFILATSGLVIANAKICITDAVLLLWVTIAQLCLYAIWRGNASWPIVLSIAVAIGLAGLTKGPVVLGFLAMTLVVLGALRLFDSRFVPLPAEEVAVIRRRGGVVIKTIVGLLIIAAITLPWILMVNHRASKFLSTAVSHEVWDRMMTSLEQHTGPPGYYLLSIWITFFPWSMMLPTAIGLAIRYRANPQTRFALAAIVGPWIMLECVRTKLPHYFLPVFPPLAFLTADAIVRCLAGQHDDLKSRGFVRGIGIWAIIVALLASAPWLVTRAYHPLPYAAMTALSIFGIVFGATVFAFFKSRRIVAGAVAMGVGTMALVAIAYGCYLPRADFLRLSPRVADVLIANDVVKPHQVIMLGYMEPSLAFYQGGTMREAGPIGLTRNFVSQFPQWMVVSSDVWKQATPDVRELFDVVADVRGLAYADRGRWVDVMVLRRKAG
jgi:4-amino-4-deoxy-L-arabinose transferase-like glycosyltransferase